MSSRAIPAWLLAALLCTQPAFATDGGDFAIDNRQLRLKAPAGYAATRARSSRPSSDATARRASSTTGTSPIWARSRRCRRCGRRSAGPSADRSGRAIWVTNRCMLPHTKILEGRTNIRERISKVLFKEASPELSTHPFEKCLENTFPNVRSIVQNLRLGSINLVASK
jgi:hypothetical protein